MELTLHQFVAKAKVEADDFAADYRAELTACIVVRQVL
jgi:hypothetical protein